ncbi:MAG: hypothetical protein H0X37_02945 [Herpetosiphonaceae bacterium]|nr:hypothetical protein [Herpetosiphonaceae bacterium]
MGTYTDLTLNQPEGPRTYHVYAPDNLTNRAPVVIVLHGTGGSAQGMIGRQGESGLTHFGDVADANGFLVVAPDAGNIQWNPDPTAQPNDIDFIVAMLNDVANQHPIDRTHCYVTGMSDGAEMTVALGLLHSELFAAIAPVAGGLTSITQPHAPPAHPLPILAFQGDADPIWPFDGGPLGHPSVNYLPATENLSSWKSFNQCTSGPHQGPVQTDDANGTSLQDTFFTNGKRGAEVHLNIVHGGGHTWPGGPQYKPENVIGKVMSTVDASTVIWQFFSHFQRDFANIIPH